MTFTPVGPRDLYTWSQVRSGPTSTVPALALTFMELKRVNAISTPEVDENPGFMVCPPPFTAKGVLHYPRIFIYAKSEKRSAGAIDVGEAQLTILLTSSAEPGSTEHAESWLLEREKCEMSDVYWGAA